MHQTLDKMRLFFFYDDITHTFELEFCFDFEKCPKFTTIICVIEIFFFRWFVCIFYTNVCYNTVCLCNMRLCWYCYEITFALVSRLLLFVWYIVRIAYVRTYIYVYAYIIDALWALFWSHKRSFDHCAYNCAVFFYKSSKFLC